MSQETVTNTNGAGAEAGAEAGAKERIFHKSIFGLVEGLFSEIQKLVKEQKEVLSEIDYNMILNGIANMIREFGKKDATVKDVVMVLSIVVLAAKSISLNHDNNLLTQQINGLEAYIDLLKAFLYQARHDVLTETRYQDFFDQLIDKGYMAQDNQDKLSFRLMLNNIILGLSSVYYTLILLVRDNFKEGHVFPISSYVFPTIANDVSSVANFFPKKDRSD